MRSFRHAMHRLRGLVVLKTSDVGNAEARRPQCVLLDRAQPRRCLLGCKSNGLPWCGSRLPGDDRCLCTPHVSFVRVGRPDPMRTFAR